MHFARCQKLGKWNICVQVEVMAQAAGVNSGTPNNSAPVQMPPQAQPVSSQKPDPDGNSAQPPPSGKAV
jgi:hypothetical protein